MDSEADKTPPPDPDATAPRGCMGGCALGMLVFAIMVSAIFWLPDSDKGLMGLFGLTCLVLIGLYFWSSRSTLRSLLGATALSALYMGAVVATIERKLFEFFFFSMTLFFGPLLAAPLVFYLLARSRRVQGRLPEAKRLHRCVWASLAMIPAALCIMVILV
jgi:hypothetical protein